MDLVKIIYYRDDNVENVKTAIVTENQLDDIKRFLRHIRVIDVCPASKVRERIY